MPPKKPLPSAFELFQSRLDTMLDPGHPLVKLAALIDWSRFDAAFGRFYTQKDRPGLPTRLMSRRQPPQRKSLTEGSLNDCSQHERTAGQWTVLQCGYWTDTHSIK